MRLARTYAVAFHGVQPQLISIDANVGPGLPGIYIVGLGDAAIAEARERIRTAARNLDLPWPKTKITVSMSPADVRKHGAHFDLAIMIAILQAGRSVPKTLFMGEVALNGDILGVKGVLPALLAAKAAGCVSAVVPIQQAQEAALVEGMAVYLARNVAEVLAWVQGDAELAMAEPAARTAPHQVLCMSDISGQDEAKRALEIAAAGGHHMMLIGPPGSGKSMLAQRIVGILPALTPQQQLEAAAIHSIIGSDVPLTAPFIAPHHSVTQAALIGGGSGHVGPGAVSLAHHGVLFLDEVSEIPAQVLDCLRTPLENAEVRLLRNRHEYVLPARFQLMLAANPCRCGAEEETACVCKSHTRRNYLSNVSGPLRDRIDITARTYGKGALLHDASAEPSATIAQRVLEAQQRAKHRWGVVNAQARPRQIRRDYPADEAGMGMLASYLAEGLITQRSVDRALKVAWTICDLAGGVRPTLDHVAQAVEVHGAEV